MKKKILGICLSICLLVFSAIFFAACGEKTFNVTLNFDQACVVTGYGTNQSISSKYLEKENGNPVIRIKGYPNLYNYDEMQITINGVDAGDKFVKETSDSSYDQQNLGYIILDKAEDVNIKIGNIKEREIKIAFILSASELIDVNNRTVVKGETPSEEYTDYFVRALLFANNYRLKLSASDYEGNADLADNTNANGTLFTSILDSNSSNLIYTDSEDNKHYAPIFFTFKASDFYTANEQKVYISEGSDKDDLTTNWGSKPDGNILWEYSEYNFSYIGIPVYNEAGLGYLKSPGMRSYTVADDFFYNGEFVGYLGDVVYFKDSNAISYNNRKDDMTNEEYMHLEYITTKIEDNCVIVIDPSNVGYEQHSASSDVPFMHFQTGFNISSSINLGYVGGIREFETTSLEGAINDYGLDMSNATLKINDLVLEKVADETEAKAKLAEGALAVCVYNETATTFNAWINSNVLPIHLYELERIKDVWVYDRYDVTLVNYTFPKENYTKITASNLANSGNPDGTAWNLMSGFVLHDENGDSYVSKNEENCLVNFLQPIDFNNTNKSTIFKIKKNGAIDEEINLMEEIAKEKANLQYDDGAMQYFLTFKVDNYDFMVAFQDIDASAQEITDNGNIYSVIVTLPLAGANEYEITTSTAQ